MITLITGGPGMGKTALAIKIILQQYKGRALFTNIRELSLDHSPLPRIEEWTKEHFNEQGTSEHQFTFPPGSLVVIDECQQFFRPRSSGSRVPPYVSAFETHRHRGIDFILITQGSGLLDSNIKKLVKGGLHIFLKSSYIGRYRYEKSECIDEESKASYGLASRRKYTLPKDVFPLYKSAELHTKPPRARLPIAAYIVIFAVVGGGLLAWRAQSRISEVVSPAGKTSGSVPGAPGAAQPQPSAPGALPASSVQVNNLLESTIPLDVNDPMSAPLYADKKPPVQVPRVVGCVASRASCACYSQQNTVIWVPEPQCRARVAGLYYDPYALPPEDAQRSSGYGKGQDRVTRQPATTTTENPVSAPVPSS